MVDRPETVERLREALISLERSRRRERELRAAEAAMFDVVRVLALAERPRETFASLLESLRGVVPFQDAAILARDERTEDGSFRPAARTSDWLATLRLLPGRMLARVIEGQTVVLFDAGLVPEWRAQARAVRERARSVIQVPLRTGAAAVVLVCTHAQPARFERWHVDVLKRVVPLAGQILQKLDLRETLAARDHERHGRLAMFDAIVNHIQAGVLVEDDRGRVFATNGLLASIFGDATSGGDLVGTDAIALNARLARLMASPEAFASRTAEITRDRVVVKCETHRLSDGRVVERDYTPVTTADAGFIAHFWQYREVTARATAEEQLRRRQRRETLSGHAH
jgi:hypothetical protein